MSSIMLVQMTSACRGLVSGIETKTREEAEVRGLCQEDSEGKYWFPEALPYCYLGTIAVLTPQHLVHGMGTSSAGTVRRAQTPGSGGSQRRARPNSWSVKTSALGILPLKSQPECQMWPKFSSQNKAAVFTGADCSTVLYR